MVAFQMFRWIHVFIKTVILVSIIVSANWRKCACLPDMPVYAKGGLIWILDVFWLYPLLRWKR